MNKKNIKLMILAVLVATTFSTGTVLAAKPDFSDKKGVKVQQKEEKSDKKEKEEKDNKKQDKANKKVSKEARIIDQRLDHIEKTLDKINEKMDSYFNNIEEPAETTTGSSIDGTLGQNDEAAEADRTEKLEDTSKEDAVVDSNDTESTDEASVSNSDEDTENSSEVDTDENTEVDTDEDADEQDLSDDFEEEYENEDEETNNSFYGKLNAVMNRLNTVKRQLGRISTVDDPQIAELNTRTEALVKEVQESISKLGTIQQKKVDALKSKTNKKVMEEEKIDAAKKSWKIRFTKQINPDTINSENISVIDSKNNVIDAEVSYSSNTNEVIIEVKDGFKKGESYSILIGDNVKSADGKNLTTSVQKDFSVK